MKPKKRNRDPPEESKTQFDQIQADHDAFLQAFEKPTQIYRYLRTRSCSSPMMLQRTLSYMKGRNSRLVNTRQGFKIDSILAKVEAKQKKQHFIQYKSEFMNLTFLGFFDKEGREKYVEVEAILVKICHKKRKDVSTPMQETSLGRVKVACNPEVTSPSKLDVISVANGQFAHNNGHLVRSYMLVLQVRRGGSHSSYMCNGDADGMPAKRTRRSSPARVQPPTDKTNTSPGTPTHGSIPAPEMLGAELVVYDKHQRCLTTEGDYEVALQPVYAPASPKKQATWETIMDGKAVVPFEVFGKCPTLKFRLSWNQTALNDGSLSDMDTEEFIQNNHISGLAHSSPHRLSEKNCKDLISPSKRKRIFYQFLYNNNTRQQTEARSDLHCPWCSLRCPVPYSLLKHLRTSHARFNFIYSEHPKGIRIDVSINEHYNGAYAGNPQDLHIGYAFSRVGPARRTPVTYVLVYRPKKLTYDMSEFMDQDNENNTRQLVQGHNRLYYHTVSCMPKRAYEMDDDSDDEVDPLWLRQKTCNMIEEFTDVNEGKKKKVPTATLR